MSSNLVKKISSTWQKVKSDILNGSAPAYVNFNSHPIIGTGASISFNQDSSVSVQPDSRNHISLSPESTILVKKKVFSSLRSANDLKFMDKTEKMFLRATKALFAYKVQQIRAYESLTKFDSFYDENNAYDLSYLSTLLSETKILNSLSGDLQDNFNLFEGGESPYKFQDKDGNEIFKDLEEDFEEFIRDLAYSINGSNVGGSYSEKSADISEIMKRHAFSRDKSMTTWIVDPSNPENYITGPGTGVIELTLFNSFNTSINNTTSPSNASINVTYPYRIGTILEADIEIAVEEALKGSLGILSDLMNGDINQSAAKEGAGAILDGVSALSSAFELSGEDTFDTAIDTDYIRERLRTFYLGKPFISASDVVHFYVRGNRSFSDYSDSGSSYSEGQSESPFDLEYMEIDETILKAEYRLYTNQAIDYETYKSMRSLNDKSFGMVHVYAGLVTDTTESFSGGFWNLKINCTDNMSWLKWSRFQSEPPISDPKNILEDPLTPFELTKNPDGSVSGSKRDLLYENKQLLQSGLLRYDSGLLAGQSASEGNLIQGQYNGIGSSNGKKLMQHPSGFIYRWKTGIITATAGFAVADPIGDSREASQWGQRYQQTVTNNVLNNLDIPNVLSIMIVGQPYNIETFIEQAFTAHNISDKSGRLSQLDPLTGVLDTVRKQNKFYGNFHPYRSLTMSSATTEKVLNNAGNRNVINDNIKNLQERKRSLRSRARALSPSPNYAAQNAGIIAVLNSEMQSIDLAIKEQIYIGTNSDNALSSEEKIGIEISLGGSSNLPVSGDDEENNDITRAMMMVGAQRRIEDVRMNRDRNLFIVSDQYDATDIRPFILKLNKSGWNLFDGKYVDVWQSCNEVTNYLHLEFFANSQGHLEFRPPLWNRVPITVLKEAIKQQNINGKKIMPHFITDLFQTRIEALYLMIHTQNIKIALASLMIGRYPDKTMIPNVPFSGQDSLAFFGIEENKQDGFGSTINKVGNWLSGQPSSPDGLRLRQTEFETSEKTKLGSFLGDNLNIKASFQDKGDILSGNTDIMLGTFDKIIQEQASITNDLETIVAGNASQSPSGAKAVAQYSSDSLNSIRDTFKRQFGRDPASGLIGSGEKFSEKDLLWKRGNIEDLEASLSSEDNIVSKIRKAISDRDSYVSMLQANISKVNELDEIESFLSSGESSDGFEAVTGDSTGSDALNSDGLKWLGNTSDFLAKSANALQTSSDILTGKVAEGTVYDHLIEDDTRNLLGYGSGKRFILKDESIISANFSESPPEFTRVDVTGNAPLVGDSLSRGFDGLYFWAGATDFDLWRQYGYKQKQISLPFISDPEGQGKPFAILELAMQKMKINKGSLTIVGNEFYQPGDTVYVPSKGLLYYVSSVSHSFSFGSSFTTSLQLEYGHAPGGYIPSPLDVIGQQLVSNFLEDPAIMYRSDESDDNYRVLQPDSSLVFPSGGETPSVLLAHSDNQVRFTNMMIDLMGSLSGSKYVLIRGFASSESAEEEIEDALKKMAVVRFLLENPSQLQQAKPFSGGDDLIEAAASAARSIGSVFGGGGGVDTTKSLTGMRLPNNLPVIPVSSSKIIEQVSYFRGSSSDDTGQIRCLDRELFSMLRSDNILEGTKYKGVFPKGGPSQGSWLDLRDLATGLNTKSSFKSNVVEVGIITLPSSILTKTLPGSGN